MSLTQSSLININSTLTNSSINNKKMKNVKIIFGRSNPELINGISKTLGEPVKVKFSDFANNEISVEIKESVRSHHVFIVQTGSNDDERSINDYILELIALVDACRRASAKTITVIIPFFMYARGDKKDSPRTPIMCATLATILEGLNVNRIISLDLHSGQAQGNVQIPFDNLYGNMMLIKKIQEIVKELNISDYTFGSPDAGGVKRVDNGYAKLLNKPFIILHKQRDYTKENTVIDSVVIGKKEYIEGKIIVLVDDMFDTFGTIIAAAKELKEKGALGVIAVATHGVFSGPAIQRINDSDDILKVIVTNSLPQKRNLEKIKNNKLVVVDVSDLLSDVIYKIRTNGSVSSLFDNH